MKPSIRHFLSYYPAAWVGAGLFALAAIQVSAAVIPTPVWYGDENTTYQSYTFSTSSTTASPEQVTNPYGSPELLVAYVPSGGVGTGYQDPANEFAINRVDGAWDLGPDGSIQITVPVAPPVGEGLGYVVDVYISVVYEPTPGFYNPPDVFVTPTTSLANSLNPTFEQDGFFYWGLKTAEGTIGEVPSELLTVLIDATGETGSLIDTIEVHTRYQAIVPEPGATALVFGVFTLIGLVIRRSRRNRLTN